MSDDAEWVGVDFEFGRPNTPTTARPAIRPRPRPPAPPLPEPATDPPRELPEVTETINSGSNNAAAVGGSVGGVLGVVLVLLLVYMLVLRRKLNKAKHSGKESKYQLRVEDVAHITNLDETSNTYVNTTDLQKLVASVRAKGKSADRLPTPPRLLHQTPAPYRPPNKLNNGALPGAPSAAKVENNGFRGDGDVVVMKAPMPIPHSSTTTLHTTTPVQELSESDAIYCNLQDTLIPARLPPPSRALTSPARPKVEAPRIAPPPPPANLTNSSPSAEDKGDKAGTGPTSPTVIARPAPPPPTAPKTQLVDVTQSPTQAPWADVISSPPIIQKPTPPPVALKPSKGPQADVVAPTLTPTKPTTAKPTPPTLPKPGVVKKGKGLPPLKMALLPSRGRASPDNTSTPDTSIIELTPDSTPAADENVGAVSISAKIAFLEGKMKASGTPARGQLHRT
nr:vegetative cell wall protein gp1-like [Procambarus clarkii]